MCYSDALPEMVEATTGMDVDVTERLTVGERVYNIQRAFNARESLKKRQHIRAFFCFVKMTEVDKQKNYC